MAVIQFLNTHGAIIVACLMFGGTLADAVAKSLPPGKVQRAFAVVAHIGVAGVSAFKEATAIFIPPTGGQP